MGQTVFITPHGELLLITKPNGEEIRTAPIDSQIRREVYQNPMASKIYRTQDGHIHFTTKNHHYEYDQNGIRI